jgi:hypothetical protein
MHIRNLALFVLGTVFSLFAQSEPKTATLSCWPNPTTFQSDNARTPTFHSDKAGDAYAEVKATARNEPNNTQMCSNTVRLFYASPAKDYKLIFHEHHDGHGLGITILGWSEDGIDLLFQTDNWPYETEGNIERETFLFDSSSGTNRKIPVVLAFRKLFGKNCEFDERVLGWHGDDALRVRISKTPPTESYEQKFCVQKPTDYVFDLKTYGISKLE